MNVTVILIDNGVACVAKKVKTAKSYLTDLIGKDKIVVEIDDKDIELSSVDELYDMLEESGDVGESVICKFGCIIGVDYCTLAVTTRKLE